MICPNGSPLMAASRAGRCFVGGGGGGGTAPDNREIFRLTVWAIVTLMSRISLIANPESWALIEYTPGGTAVNRKAPSGVVNVLLGVKPGARRVTVTPGSGLPCSSTTVPLIRAVDGWAARTLI